MTARRVLLLTAAVVGAFAAGALALAATTGDLEGARE